MDSNPPASRSTGSTYWITGLPGAGKTSLARRLTDRMTSRDRSVVQIDGDRIRAVLGGTYGHGQRDRHVLAGIYSRACLEFNGQGHAVVCATVSMFRDIRSWNRANIPGYCEIYLEAPIALLAERHPKGLYAAALAGRIRNVPGVDLAIETPENPDLRIALDAFKTPDEVALELFRYLDMTTEGGDASR